MLFVDKAQNNRLSGVIIDKKGTSEETVKTYSNRFALSENMILTLQGANNEYIIEKPNPYQKFFNFFIKNSSFIAENVHHTLSKEEETGKMDLKVILIKSLAIIIAISAISFFLATGKWPLINYVFSQVLVICFIWFNSYIQKIPIPQFLKGAENLIPFDSGIYYFAYIVISFCIVLIKILSLNKARR